MTTDANAQSQVLLVEGRDEEAVVLRICERVSSIPDFAVIDKKGVSNLLAAIEGETKAPGRITVGILVDANDDLDSRWRALRQGLSRAGVAPPAAPDPNGSVIEGNRREGRPRVGVWLMPDNERPGELEDFIAAMIPDDDPVWPLSRAYVAGIPEEHRKFTSRKTRKAEVHAWLAARAAPRPMGIAIRARDLDVESAVCRRFVGWLRELFVESV